MCLETVDLFFHEPRPGQIGKIAMRTVQVVAGRIGNSGRFGSGAVLSPDTGLSTTCPCLAAGCHLNSDPA